MSWFDILKRRDIVEELNANPPFKPIKQNRSIGRFGVFPIGKPFYDKRPPYFPSRAGKGGQKVFKKWLRPFIKKHLESLTVGETTTTKKVLEVVKKNMSASQLKTKRISTNTIGTLIGENRDIIKREVYQPEHGKGGWRRI